MTGKSETTVRRIAQGDLNNGIFSTPGKKKKGRPLKELDNFSLCAIRQKIQFFDTVRKQAPTLRNLLPLLREDLGYDGSHEHLRGIIKMLGFKYMKCQSERSALIEKPNIAAKRIQYLKTILKDRNLPDELQKDIIYLDESYVHQSYKLSKCWQSVNVPGIKQSISKGKRYIIIHAGSEKGFVPNALLIFSGSNKKSDYHSEMNRENFTKWVTEKLIPNLPQASIVVMDNAPYHSTLINKAPTSGTKIADIKNWLSENQIDFDETLRKPELLMLAKRHKPPPRYEIDEILGAHGHTVEAAEKAFNEITQKDWENSCKHVKNIENKYYERELTLYQDIEELVIGLRDDSSATSYSDMEDESAPCYMQLETSDDSEGCRI